LIENIWWGLDGALIETKNKSHSTIEPAPLGIDPNQTNRPEPDTLMGLPAKVMPHSTLGDRPHHPTTPPKFMGYWITKQRFHALTLGISLVFSMTFAN